MEKIGFLCAVLSLALLSFVQGVKYGRSDFKHVDNTLIYETDYVKSIKIDTLYKNIKDSTYVFNIKMIE